MEQRIFAGRSCPDGRQGLRYATAGQGLWTARCRSRWRSGSARLFSVRLGYMVVCRTHLFHKHYCIWVWKPFKLVDIYRDSIRRM
eukprot:2631949-Pleurochrysis_carterae.AAC.1